LSQSLERVVLVAENCSVRMGGEAILPYHYFRLLRARGVDAHLVVHERVREELLRLFPTESGHLHFIPDHTLQKLFFRLGKPLPHRLQEATLGLLNQLLTQAAARSRVGSLAVPGCVVHQPIPVSPRFPSLLYGLDARVVIGPMNGGMTFPPAFEKGESAFSRFALRLGRTFADRVNRIFPGKLQADIVLVANDRTRNALPTPIQGKIAELVENGVDLSQWKVKDRDALRTGSFLFIGRLVDWKALDLVLEAMEQVPEASLDVIGDGPMLAQWRALASGSLAGRVRFLGWKTQAECAEYLAHCTALVLPSLYECGGAVVLEAMAMSRPVIATAWGGPVDYLDEHCGILVEPRSRTFLVQGFADAMRTLTSSPGLGDELGRAGRVRLLEHFDWDRKIDRMLEIYQEALS
jgi:glycosyltransferase involved in cell wall biosynthesis